MKRSLKLISILVSLLLVAIGFQNCGESLDLSELEAQASLSRQPSVSLSPDSSDMVENTSYKIDLNIQNYQDYSIEWWKDGVLLEGFDGDQLIFEPAQMEDAGEYYAVLVFGDNTTVRTDPVTISVSVDETVTIYNLPNVVNGALTYYLNSATNPAATAEAYCKRTLGSAAISTAYEIRTQVEQIRYTARAEDQAACGTLPYIDGMCLRFDPGQFEPELNIVIGPFVRRLQTVTCRPQPIIGLQE